MTAREPEEYTLEKQSSSYIPLYPGIQKGSVEIFGGKKRGETEYRRKGRRGKWKRSGKRQQVGRCVVQR